MSRKLWTCVVDFRGGTYVRQTFATSPERATIAALRAIGDGAIPHLAEEALRAVLEEVTESSANPVPIEGMKGVFCASILVGKHLMMMHLIETRADALVGRAHA